VDDLTLTDLSATTKTTIRAADDTAAAASLGLQFGSSERRDGDLVVRIRPDEWLVIGSTTTVDALDLTGFASRVDTTHSRLLFRLTGDAAAKVMEKICSVDFGDHMTPNGACAGASVAKVGCDIVRDDVDGVRSYLILADTSYRTYLHAAVTDAMTEFRA
jgi:sarcosine oxidase subunit alpha